MGDHHQRVVVHVAWPRLVYQLVRDYVFVLCERFGHLDPVVLELLQEFVFVVVKGTESLVYRKCRVVRTPRMLAAVLPSWHPSLIIKLERLRNGQWEPPGQALRDGPDGHPICTEFLTKQILMELHQSVNAIITTRLNQFIHRLQIRLVVLPLLRLDSGPHDSQPNGIHPPALEILHVLLRK